ncbi:Nucleoporin FG repeat region-containing protein [Elsinoe fawcettii]|nr:Nucleoporin FG repeat region-containing protein [Elsinoe fawcettii]
MAFGRSNSLSINTGATNSLFASQQNNTSQPAQTGGLFGSTNNAPKPGGLFGSSTTGTAGQTGGTSLFGGSTQQQSQPQQTGGLFGGALGQNQNQTQTQQAGQTGTSLFGGLGQNNAASQPAQGSSLFGGLGQSQQQNKPTGLFGGLGQSTTQQPQQQTSSLFGNLNQSQQPKPSGLFGSLNQPPQQQQPQPQQTQTAPSLLSASLFNAPLPAPLAGSLSMGQPTSVPSTTQPGVKIDITSLRPTTRFSDLHDDLKKQIETLDSFIKTQESYAAQCEALLPSHSQNVTSLDPDVKLIESKLDTVEIGLENDSADVHAAKGSLDGDKSDFLRVVRVIENLQLPSRFHYGPSLGGGRQGAGAGLDEEYDVDLLGYFTREVQGMDKVAGAYWGALAEVEQHLGVVERSVMDAARGGGEETGTVQELAATLRGFEKGILDAAGKVGEVREGVGSLVLGRAGF